MTAWSWPTSRTAGRRPDRPGKSTFAVALALCHAAGLPFLDRETTQGIPLILDWESTADDLEEKLWLLGRWHGLRSIPKVHRLKMGGPAVQHAAAIANRIDSSARRWSSGMACKPPAGRSGRAAATKRWPRRSRR